MFIPYMPSQVALVIGTVRAVIALIAYFWSTAILQMVFEMFQIYVFLAAFGTRKSRVVFEANVILQLRFEYRLVRTTIALEHCFVYTFI